MASSVPLIRTLLLAARNHALSSTSRRSFAIVTYAQDLKPLAKSQAQLESPAEVAVITSPALKGILPPARIYHLQRLISSSDNPFLKELDDIRNLQEYEALLERYADSMDTAAAIAGGDVAFAFLKNESSVGRRKEIWNSVGFQKLQKALWNKCRHMGPGDLVNTVKLLIFVGMSANELGLQMILKVLTKHVNNLDLQELTYLQFLLAKFQPESKSPISTALEMALPVIFEGRILSSFQSGELDREDVNVLCDHLYYAVKLDVGNKSVEKLVSVLEKRSHTLSPKDAVSVVWSLSDAKWNDQYQKTLVQDCFRIMAEKIEKIDVNMLSTIMSKSAKKYTKKKVLFFYHEDFVQAFCNLFMRHNTRIDQSLFGFKHVSLFRHVHVEYMDRVGEIIAAQPSLVLNDDYLFFNTVRGFAGCNYKPDNWNKLEPLFLNHPAVTKNLGTSNISLAVDFLCLDCFPETLLHKIFSPDELPNLENFFNRNPLPSAYVLLLILNSVKILYPQYAGPLPPTSMINKWKDLLKKDRERFNVAAKSLKASLQTGFGGEDYVISNIAFNGLAIDHGIVMRKGGYPIAITSPLSEGLDVTEIRKPEESEVVLIKVFWKESFSNNTARLRGLPALEQRILEGCGHPLIVVDSERWALLQDFEKIPFLMHKIKEKVDKFQWNQKRSDVIPR